MSNTDFFFFFFSKFQYAFLIFVIPLFTVGAFQWDLQCGFFGKLFSMITVLFQCE